MNKFEQLNSELATICIEGLAELVKAMREAQVTYSFKRRDVDALMLSKSLECQVDTAVKKILNKELI